jgi:hemerythrin HHE cation binding domain-containing protein
MMQACRGGPLEGNRGNRADAWRTVTRHTLPRPATFVRNLPGFERASARSSPRHDQCVCAPRLSRTDIMKATTLLERQHLHLLQLCDAVEWGSASVRDSLLPQLAGDLLAHLAIEARLFYPAIARLLGDERLSPESLASHVRACRALDRTLMLPTDGADFSCAMGDLRAIVADHCDEADQLLFPRLEREIDAVAMRDLAHDMLALYHVEVEMGYARRRSSLASLLPPSPDSEQLPFDEVLAHPAEAGTPTS